MEQENRHGWGRRLRRAGAILLKSLAWAALVLFMAWAALALWFDSFKSPWLAGAMVACFLAGGAALPARLRPRRRAMLAAWGWTGAVLLWWLLIPPRNDRAWTPEVARLPRARIDQNMLTIDNVRNFVYRSESDCDERWETRAYDLDQVRGADLFLCFWGPTLIAHTISSWEFADGRHLAVSIETRKEQGDSYSAVRGFFRQFELYYVVADERDVIGLRARQRGERVWLYRMAMPPAAARALLVQFAKEFDTLARRPRWYNALSHNCTTAIRHNAKQVAPVQPFDWRILANGHLDELGYMRGSIDTTLPFAEMRRRSEITQQAIQAGAEGDFSAAIRASLPPRPSTPPTQTR
jgi:hypothetical protein